MAKRFLKQYEILFKKAVVDLNTAKVVLESFNNGNIELDMEIIYFHLQQSCEKLLKTLLDFNHIKFPHTHDLEDLYLLLEDNNIELIINIQELLPLTEFAVEGRYSIIHDELDDAQKYIHILEEFFIFTKERINETK